MEFGEVGGEWNEGFDGIGREGSDVKNFGRWLVGLVVDIIEMRYCRWLL